MFFVHLSYLQWLQKQRDLVKERGFPSRKAILGNPKYEECRQAHERGGPQATWPEHAERAFFEVLDEMLPPQRFPLERPSDALTLGEGSRLAPLLESLYTPGEKCGGTNEIAARLITAVSGVPINRKQVSSHVQVMKSLVPLEFTEKHSAMSVVLRKIASIAESPPYKMHDAIYDLLHQDTLEVDDSGLSSGNDVQDLEVIVNSVSPAFRYGIRSILLTNKDDKFASFVRILDDKKLPGLESLYLRCCMTGLDGNSQDGSEE
ncbi:MAG: hypothetical protein Q9183_004464 [Haloplaca sp. 2 TL-2023]